MRENLNLTYLIKQLELGLRRPFMAAVEAHGLSGAQYTALTVLARLPGITSSELARRSFVRAQTMAETMSALLDAGYVTRREDPTHRRRILLEITPIGLEALDRMRDDVQSIEDRLTSAMTEEQAVQLESLLRLARRGLRSYDVASDNDDA
ncbi:MarR family winged helix-turn-helix transcriptional regulator [Streptomyces albidoflavus]